MKRNPRQPRLHGHYNLGDCTSNDSCRAEKLKILELFPRLTVKAHQHPRAGHRR